jgi:hypothetical protein
VRLFCDDSQVLEIMSGRLLWERVSSIT